MQSPTPLLAKSQTAPSPASEAKRFTAILERPIPRWKRAFDITGVVFLAPLLLPLLALIAFYIRSVSKGPVLFVQLRLGHGGKYFSIYKFRTMHVTDASRDDAHRKYVTECASAAAPIKKPDHQSSLILGGNLLRKLSIDELPQLLNVWQGTMSLVGPRPDVLLRQDYEDEQLRRFEVPPGMTGLWQVSGKNSLTFDQMIELDTQYIDRQSLALDVWILFKTIKVLLLERNE